MIPHSATRAGFMASSTVGPSMKIKPGASKAGETGRAEKALARKEGSFAQTNQHSDNNMGGERERLLKAYMRTEGRAV